MGGMALLVLTVVIAVFVAWVGGDDKPAPVPGAEKPSATIPRHAKPRPIEAMEVVQGSGLVTGGVAATPALPSTKTRIEIPTPSRTWKGADGGEVLGRVMEIDLEAETVLLHLASGKVYEDFPVSKFSDGDQVLLLGRKAKAPGE